MRVPVQPSLELNEHAVQKREQVAIRQTRRDAVEVGGRVFFLLGRGFLLRSRDGASLIRVCSLSRERPSALRAPALFSVEVAAGPRVARPAV